MRRLGIAQLDDDPLLREPTVEFNLPAEVAVARRIVAELRARAADVRAVHAFRKGMGLAAPQIGFGRRVAIVHTPDVRGPIVLLNPRVVHRSAADEVRFEGCLSFFDVRGKVRRPVHLVVESQALDGTPRTTRFEGSLARLVAHEIDHLDGVLYCDRMAATDVLMPVEHYRATEAAGNY
ncbi:peptide deformylase [Cryptosporangium aurantiacum]|uniref:Peptide deformylase n=1 Tax=Cryptosporangium aurantiacum TaxID=134849 RepID=A0A1M7IS02_9ACTN|nr:peptide deformylase [Cryptosporangium aurantiacum]SHM43572.1 peptide deformylase [Cryptosporangium aurantiacum]